MVRMPDFPLLDDLDRGITLALQVNPRASWKQVAKAVGSTESTVMRRGQQLLGSRTVSVTGVLDHLRCGLGVSVYVRFRAKPGRELALAQAVASLASPRFVTLTMGSVDVVAEVVVGNHRQASLASELERIEDVLNAESMMVIRKFSAFEEWDPGIFDEQATQLLRSGGALTTYAHRDWVEPIQLKPQEFEIAATLAHDGRASYAAIASSVGISESTAARRVESLVSRGCLRFRTLFEAQIVGLDVEFMLWLTVEPSRIEEIGEQLATHPATRYVSATTGHVNLIVQAVLRSYGDLYQFMTHTIGALPGVFSADLTLQAETLKRAWIPIDANGRAASASWASSSSIDPVGPRSRTEQRQSHVST